MTTRRIAFDVVEMRPGCVLIAAALGASVELAKEFPVESWILQPSDDMRVYEVTDEQLAWLKEVVNDRLGAK